MKPLRILLLYAQSADNATFSYQHGWPSHFLRHARIQCTPINLFDPGMVAAASRLLTAATWRGDAVVLLHSVFSNANFLSERLAGRLARLGAPKAYFLGNEYKHMPAKLAMCQQLPVALLVSQSNDPRVHALYRQRVKSVIIGLPNTGLDPDLFQSRCPRADRPIDLGYRSDVHGFYLGHTEREDLSTFFLANAARFGLKVDISTSPRDRLAGPDWAGFLNRCKGQIGTEAGLDYFELTDETRTRVNDYVAAHPDASFREVWNRFFRDYRDPVPMRIISGRNVEAAGTRTVQILMEGRYDGYFEPDVHYIPLKKDLSNADEAIAKFRDTAFCEQVSAAAHRVATEEFTYTRLIDRFADALAPLV